jgi:hypothetical protein
VKYPQTKQDDDLARFVIRRVSKVSWPGMLNSEAILFPSPWLSHCYANFPEKYKLSD